MLSFQNLSMVHRDSITKAVSESGMRNSEMNFASMYIWRHAWQTSVCEEDGAIFILEHKPLDPEPAHVLPVLTEGPLKPALERLMKDMQERNVPFLMRSVDERMKERMEEAMPGAFSFCEDVAFYDYVYNGDDLRELTGKRYHAKRNHINKFEQVYEGRWKYRRIPQHSIHECLSLYDKWAEGRDWEGEALSLERRAIREAMHNLDELGLICGAIEIDGEVAAFSVGEQSGDMAYIHIEKADADVPGLYAAINQQFARHELSTATFINREEDIGIEGLRKAKQSYYPCHMIKKYVARPAGERCEEATS